MEIINLKENTQQKEILIKSLQYLPQFLQDKPVMKDAAKLLDACLSQEVDVLAEIYQAYCDTLYKIAAYNQLSYGAKLAFLKEKGFEYLLDILKNIYEEKYNQLSLEERKKITLEQYLEQQTSTNLANITMLFNLLYIFKGKTLGLELALELVNCPEFIYIPWDIVANYKGEWDSFDTLPLPGGDIEVNDGDCYTIKIGEISTDVIFNGVSWHKCTSYKQYLTPRQQFTAELTIWGLASATLQARIAEFVRYYMLPYIEVKLEFTASMDPVYCFPSGDRSLLRSLSFSNYYTDNGEFVHKNLSHTVSQNSWQYTNATDKITVGQPLYNKTAFQGVVDLNTSFVKRGDSIYYLFGQTKTIPDFITGPALAKLTEDGTLINFDGDYVQAPLKQDYVLVDIVTGEQINPHYENDKFIRDTIIKYNTCLLVEGIHHAKLVEQVNSLLIEDFDRDLEETEVYAGRVTEIHVENPAGVMFFDTNTPYVREKTGKEDTIYLKFTDAFVKDYTGIGDLGILGSNTYFIYNNMLYRNNGDEIVQLDTGKTWTDVGASHAVSETYYTPAICNGDLVYIKDDKYYSIERDSSAVDNYKHFVQEIPMPVKEVDDLEVETLDSMELNDFKTYLDYSFWDNVEYDAHKWTHVTGYINEHYTAFAICDGRLYSIYMYAGKPHYTIVDEEQGWTYITGAFYSQTYEAYGIKNGVLYTLNNGTVIPVEFEGKPLTGWDSSFDCISRYHHSNDDYITYGICAGKLYYLQNRNVGLLSNETGWTAICGFYNENSPRTFAYAIKNGVLYELQGKTLVIKDDTYNWTDISGCTTTNNTYVLGIADNNLYQINAKTLKLVDEGGWTEVFGRTTTSTSKSANCYGYGVKNNRLIVLHNGQHIVSGMWKVNGEGAAVDLHDYNIDNIAIRVDDTYISGIDNVRTSVPLKDEPLTNYDIYITYETLGFEDNTRYQIKTEMSEIYNTYINPKDCRYDVDMDNAPEWNTETGILKDFTACPLIVHGTQKINGHGDAYEFSLENYLELPDYYKEIQTEWEPIYEYLPFEDVTIKFGCIVDNGLHPIILDRDGQTGVYFGYSDKLKRSGIFVKNGDLTRIIPVVQGNNIEYYIKFTRNNDDYEISISSTNETYQPTNTTMKSPKYLGGNGKEFGDCIVFLQHSTMYTDKLIPMYENGKYFSVNTQQQNLVERIITPVSQECQKTIEIQDVNKNLILPLYMDTMYTSRTFDISTNTLNIKDDYCYNEIHTGDNEGINYSTLTYSGEYDVDKTKAQIRGKLQDVSTYPKNTIANNFSFTNYIDINTNHDTPLLITTGNNVDDQTLLQTEEDTAYTNRYLLTSEIDCTDNRDNAHAVPSGIIFELETDTPQTVSRYLEYNAEKFEINTNIIFNTDLYSFDDYQATLSNFKLETWNEEMVVKIPFTFNTIKEEVDGTKVTTDYSMLPILKINGADTYKQNIGKIGDYYIEYGNKTLEYYNEDGVIVPDPILDPEDPNYIPLTTKDKIDTSAYNFEDYTDYYLKFDVNTVSKGYQNIILHETDSTEQKDKFVIIDGTITNFSCKNYILPQNLTTHYGLMLKLTMDDDVSKDQGIIGLPNGQSLCIKDNAYCLCDNKGNIQEISQEDLFDNEEVYLYFATDLENPTTLGNGVHVYIGEPGVEDYDLLFDTTIDFTDGMYIGYASAGSGMLPYNGTIDLARSYMTNSNMEPERLFDFTQTTKIMISEDNKNYDLMQTIITPYIVRTLNFGYDFNGSLDLFNSITTTKYGFLLPYTLGWVENRAYIDTVIKNELTEADPSYDKELDKNTYTIKEYGIHLNSDPQRWDSITVTYETKDNAYYMQPNTNYYLKWDCEIDENGKCLLEKQGTPTWKSAVVSDFSLDNYFTIQFTNEQYLVLTGILNSTEDQTLCSYVDDNSQAICIKDGKWQYFDDRDYHVICDAKTGKFAIKLYTTTNNIEYFDKKWVISDVEASFSGYEKLTIGKGNNQIFSGNIDLNESYTMTDNVNYLFTLYKKITPYISLDNVKYEPITLTPLLTLKNMISFGQGFSGELHLYESNLLDPESTYWTCNQVNVYALNDMPEDDIKKDNLVKSVLLDNLMVDATKYWKSNETVKINPSDLRLTVTGLPKIGDVITLTYNTWYLFREMNHEYDFKITYKDRAIVSYVDRATGDEYVIYEMDNAQHIVNTGYNFWGMLFVKDSTRGGQTLTEYLEWYRYVVTYRKYGETEWTKWSEFSVESKYELNKRTGFDLNGLLYMESSYVKLGNLITPFLSSWNGTYITIVGSPVIENGVASVFSENDYLMIKLDALQEGDTVSFDIKINSLEDQGIGELFYLKDGYICSGGKTLQKVYEGYKARIEYIYKNGQVTARVIGNNSTNFVNKRSNKRTLTILPYNNNLSPHDTSYYVRSSENAEKLKVYYRIGSTVYDHFTTPKLDWYEIPLQMVESINYFGTSLQNVFTASVDLGFEYDKAGNPINKNPDGLTYYENQMVEYKIVSTEGTTNTNKCELYQDKVEKQKTLF